MARTAEQIQASITTAYVAAMAAIGITIDPTQWSRRNLQKLAINIFASGTAIFEQILDLFTALIEGKIAAASPHTGKWWQAQMLKFQYDATTPQILLFDDSDGINSTFAPYYETVNTDLQIIKYATAGDGVYGTTAIKVAAQTGGLPVALSSPQLDAANSYAKSLSVNGITVNVTSGNSDKLYIAATIYYNGLYASVISDSVIAAINAYLAGIPFNGVVILSNLELAIKAVAGVNDVVLTNVQARADSTAYGSGTNLVIGVDGAVPTGNVIKRSWATIAGYIVPEDTATHELTDSLTFISE